MRQSRPRVQHSPSSMGNTMLTNDQLLTVPAKATDVAGTALATDRDPGDRAQELQTGNVLGNMVIDVTATPGAGTFGIVEYVVFKVQRSHTVPIVGTDPIPTDTEIITGGLQGAYREHMPGWVIQFGNFRISQETTAIKRIKINWNKFRMAKCRDGDFYCVTYFNRTGSTITLDWQCRYYEYK